MAMITEPMTVPEFDLSGLPEDALYEVINGKAVEKVMAGYPLAIASILHEHLAPFVRQAGLGRVIVELIFRVDDETHYRPDVAFISDARWPVKLRPPNRGVWNIIPDLVVEVVSPTDRAEKVLGKARHYFEAGVRAVWLVYPNLEVVHAFDAFDRIKVLAGADSLDGGEVIPGFRLPLAVLFEGEMPEEHGQDPAD